MTIINKLIDEGLIIYDTDYRLTDKYHIFLNWYKSNKSDLSVEIEKETEDESVEDLFDEWVLKWNSKFPTPSITNGRNLRSAKADVAERMKKFIKKCKYTFEEIDAATDGYLSRERLSGFKYCKESAYFIEKKGEGSKLLAECENLKTTDTSVEDSWTKLG